jgi:transposase-like protein
MTDSVARESSLVEPVRRRRFTKPDKARIVAEYEAAASPTERGIVLRRWGTYQQNVSRWSKEIAMTTKPSKTVKVSPAEAKLANQVAASQAKLDKANARVELLEELVTAQGKVLGLHAKNVGSPHPG